MAIITISRQMGSGAYRIAQEVAKKLRYRLIDGPKIAELARQYGISQEMLERVDEKPPVYRTAEDRRLAAHLNSIELALLEAAQGGNVILYGRGGQDLLPGLGNVLRVRFIAPFQERVESFAEREWLDPDLAHELIRKCDHQRGGFIHFYFNRDWNAPEGYDLIYNTARLSPATIVDSLVAAAKDPKLKGAEAEAQERILDLIVAKRLETALLKSKKVTYLHFRVQVSAGVVELSGHVHSDEEKDEALRLARKAEGVAQVVDGLQVVPYRVYRE